ncbi:hypothetical protein PLESTB_000045900 [Pleodorina starrii]|uniref:Uncharacterized protein n=1 Tax=Pleodorina starrii TaxID=330485 RepID=A0A9W6BA38_9CHLO|nr:hypothetical protein PLESTB_000045900 [Pleodorina starrii]
MAVDLSPFGSPVGNTPVRLPPAHRADRMRARAESDADDQSDNASVRDQRQNLVDASQLQKTLKQMQEMAEENRKLSVFLAEYKADADKLSRLEQENRALRDVTRQLEVELQDLKTNTLPRTGAELEMFKNAVRVPAAARSVCSNDETIALGASTASVDGVIPDARVRRNSVFKQLLATLQGTASTDVSQPTTPRGSVAGVGVAPRGGGGGTAGSSRQRRQPGPEEAAVIGQAVYQLLDQFGGRML